MKPEEIIAGLRQALDALTLSEGELCPGMAEALGIDEAQLAIIVGDMIWLRDVLELRPNLVHRAMALRKYETRACDRCNREVALQATPEAWEGWWEARLSRMTSTTQETLLPSRADLCPECAEEMARWWQQP